MTIHIFEWTKFHSCQVACGEYTLHVGIACGNNPFTARVKRSTEIFKKDYIWSFVQCALWYSRSYVESIWTTSTCTVSIFLHISWSHLLSKPFLAKGTQKAFSAIGPGMGLWSFVDYAGSSPENPDAFHYTTFHTAAELLCKAEITKSYVKSDAILIRNVLKKKDW